MMSISAKARLSYWLLLPTWSQVPEKCWFDLTVTVQVRPVIGSYSLLVILPVGRSMTVTLTHSPFTRIQLLALYMDVQTEEINPDLVP